MVNVQILQEVGIVGVPTLLILAGLFFNNKGLADLRADINKGLADLRKDMNDRFEQVDRRFDKIAGQITGINDDLHQFYHLSGKA